MRILLIISGLFPLWLQAQQLQVKVSDFPLKDAITKQWQGVRCLRADCLAERDSLFNFLTSEGYLRAQIDSSRSETTWDLTIVPGARYYFGNMDKSEVPASVEMCSSVVQGKPYRQQELQSCLEGVVSHLLDNGYPYAAAALREIQYSGTSIGGKISVERGPKVAIARIITSGEELSSRYLMRLGGFSENADYSEEKIARIVRKLELQGFNMAGPAALEITSEGGQIILPLEEREGDRLDGIIGAVGDPSREKLVLTGMVQLDLHNLFHTGKELHLQWERFSVNSQFLDLKYNHNHVAGSSIGFAWAGMLNKRDTSFFNRNFTLMLRYHMLKGPEIGLWTGWGGSTVIENAAGSEGPLANGESWSAGIHLQGTAESVGYRIVSGVINRRILATTGISESQLSQWPGRVLQFSNAVELNFRMNLFGNWYLAEHLTGEWLVGSQVFRNDRFQVGGTGSIRGFAEREFLTPAYFLGRTEFRWYADRDLYLFVFTDNGIFSLESAAKWLGSTGVGMEIPVSERGMLKMNWGLGKRPSRPVSVTESVIQFGFVSDF